MSDAKLLAVSDRDPGAFRVLYNRYRRSIYGYHMRRSHDEQAALDLTAETFAQVWFARRRFRDETGGSAAPWLFGIARNVLLQSVRRQRLEDDARRRLGILSEAETPFCAPEESWLDGVDELLDGLPEGQRKALELRVLEDLSYETVASRLSITSHTARMRVHRALDVLRRDHLLTTGDPR